MSLFTFGVADSHIFWFGHPWQASALPASSLSVPGQWAGAGDTKSAHILEAVVSEIVNVIVVVEYVHRRSAQILTKEPHKYLK